MQKFKELLFKLRRTRLPWIALFVVVILGTIFEFNVTMSDNRPVNEYLVHQRATKIVSLHHNQNEIFRLRTHLSALSDDHMIYLLRQMDMGKRPKLLKHAKYVNLTQKMMKDNNNDDNKIEDLQDDIHTDRKLIKADHPASPTYHIMHTRGGIHCFDKMAGNGAATIILIFLDLILLWKIVKFKDDLYKRDIGDS